jgi:chromosome segregation ATPase
MDKIARGMSTIDVEESKKKNKEELKEIERHRRELVDALSKREITIAEYYERERQLADKAEKLKNKQTAINMEHARRIVVEASKEYADRTAQTMAEMAEKRNALLMRRYEIEKEIEQLKTEMQAAELMKRYDLQQEYKNKIEGLEKEKAATEAEAAKTASDVWGKSAEHDGC